MAEFHLWTRENLVKFAADAQQRMEQQDARIESLTRDLRDMQRAWRELVVKIAASATLPASKGEDREP
jgi:hypothetical protein